MTTNKPEVFYATNLYSSAPVACLMRRTGEKAEPVIRLSDYDALQAECEKLRERDALLVELLESCREFIDPPERSCSCHISPPCSDCVNHSFERDLLERIDAAMQGDSQ